MKKPYIRAPQPPVSAVSIRKAGASREWESVQAAVADLPGEAGILRRNQEYAGYFLRLGRDVRIAEGCRFSHPDRIVLDDDVRINVGALIYGSGGVRIGRHARIGPRIFIHSANHDVESADPRAFFERGYEYASVLIGDNCLLSANVSLLPGVRLGNGVFVACGAVVTSGSYAENSRIMGVPGKAVAPRLDPAPAETPALALLVPRTGHWADAARLLVEALGLVQVRVVPEDQPISTSVSAAIAIGPSDWSPPPPGVPLWRLARGETQLRGVAELTIRDHRNARTFEFPESRLHAATPTFDPSRSALENVADLTLYYATKRLRKRHTVLTASEQLDALIAASVLKSVGDGMFEPIIGALLEPFASGADSRQPQHGLLRALRSGAHAEPKELAAAVLELGKINAGLRAAVRDGAERIDSDALLAFPELAVHVAAGRDPQAWSNVRNRLAGSIESMTRSSQVATIGAASLLAGDDSLLDSCRKRVLSEEFLNQAHGYVRSAAGSTAASYSPTLAALLLFWCRAQNTSFVPRSTSVSEHPFEWSVFPWSRGECAIATSAGRGELLDPDGRRIASSLFDCWLDLLTVPNMGKHQYELLAHNYQMLVPALDAAWLAVFRSILHGVGLPLIRVRPWPHGCRAALSVRYDVDRPTQTEHMRRIIQIQCREFNAACASWFTIRDTPQGEKLRGILPLHLQELGVHTLTVADGSRGEGVTAHSAPTSEYWRGAASIQEAERTGASYAEMLATQLGFPRRAWVDGRPTTMPLLPIHFPLEGSTSDTSLTYFDLLRPEFRQMLDQGEHVIIGSHPDLNQAILTELLHRESVRDCWCVPIAMALERVQQLLGYGKISVVQSGEETRLLSTHTMADVAVEIDAPGATPRDVCVQLNAGIPRMIMERRGPH